MSKSIKSYSQASEIIDLQYLQNKSTVKPINPSVRSHSQSLQQISNNSTKINNQQVVNNFYLTVPSVTQVQGIDINLSTNLYNQIKANMAKNNQKNSKTVEQQKLPRVKRMNIPKTTLIDRKTGEPIQNLTPGRGELGYQHIQDKQIVHRINRMLIEGGWGYSSLLGKQNRRTGQYSGQKSPRDLDFPAVLALVSDEMKLNFKKHGCEYAHLVQCPHKVKIVYDGMTFGLTPTNSRYFIYGIFCLTKNLQPALLALGFAKDQVVQTQKDEIYYTLLKTFIEANNQQLSQERRQQAARRKLIGRKIREPEIVQEYNFASPQLIFCHNQRLMAQACGKIRTEFGVGIQAHHCFLQRLQAMKAKFNRHQLKKQKSVLQRGQFVIKKMLQTNNPKEIQLGIAELKQHNQQFAYKYRKFQLGKLCFLNYERRYIGFNSYQRFEESMINYLSVLVVQRNSQTLKQFLQNILKQEEVELKKITVPFQDRSEIMKYNARLRVLVLVVQPNVLKEILEYYKIGRSLKIQKDVQSLVPRYLVGSGKRSVQVGVQFRHQIWRCQCGFVQKVGIPCAHLLRVLQNQKSTKYQDYISSKHYKRKMSTIVQIE